MLRRRNLLAQRCLRPPATPASLSIVAIEITECQNGYARVGAVPDNARCEPGGSRTYVDTEQIFLRADGENWTYPTSATGISCTDTTLEPDLASACEALGLRTRADGPSRAGPDGVPGGQP